MVTKIWKSSGSCSGPNSMEEFGEKISKNCLGQINLEYGTPVFISTRKKKLERERERRQMFTIFILIQ
jgi:hypothetical protein